MVEYILGIGQLTREDCHQVADDVTRRIEKMTQALSAIKNELDHLNTIKFQVSQREAEIWRENEKRLQTSPRENNDGQQN